MCNDNNKCVLGDRVLSLSNKKIRGTPPPPAFLLQNKTPTRRAVTEC